jgi:hypothetical protein
MSFQHVDEMTVAGMVYRIETQSSDGEQVRIAMTAYRESDPDRTPIHGILHVPLTEVPALRLVVGKCLQALMSSPELAGREAGARAGSVVAAVADSASALAAAEGRRGEPLSTAKSTDHAAGVPTDAVPRARTEARPSAPARPPRGTPPRARLPWRPEQEQDLVRRFDRGEPLTAIALAVGRTEGAVRSRLRLLGREVERTTSESA